jgi:hypothetical protein
MRKLYLAGAITIFGAVAGCRSGRTETPPPTRPNVPPVMATRPLAYTVPSTEAGIALYEFTDSTVSDIQGGGIGNIRVTIGTRGLAEVKFEPQATDLKVTVTLKEFQGTFANSAGGGTLNATLADITGPAILSLTPRGVVTMTQQPQISPTFRQVSGSEQTFRRFFLRLPGRVVQPGSSWTDTVTNAETSDGMTTRTRNIVRATYVRDTVVEGKTLKLITATSDRTLDVSGTSQGIEIRQKLTGTANGTILWDSERNLTVWRSEAANLSGTFDLPAMNLSNMPITATGRATVQLKGG